MKVPVAAEGMQHSWHSRVGVQYKFSVECLGHTCSVVLVGRYHFLQSIVLVYQNASSIDKNIQKLLASDSGLFIKLSQG